MTWKAWVEFEPGHGEYRLAVYRCDVVGPRHATNALVQIGPGANTEIKQIEPDHIMPFEDNLYLPQEILQALVDGCAKAGIVANSFSGDELKATKSHLEDMRAIAFHKVGANKP